MNFYKYFTFIIGLLMCAVIFPHFPLSANAPLSVFFISESIENGQFITIKNISANNQGNWRIALLGKNAAYFRINDQRADFEQISDHYVQLPHSLPVGGEWGFMLTEKGLAAGQHSVELALWTTQGQPQHPFNGTILGRTTLFFVVEETKDEEEDKEEEDYEEEETYKEEEETYKPEEENKEEEEACKPEEEKCENEEDEETTVEEGIEEETSKEETKPEELPETPEEEPANPEADTNSNLKHG